MMRKFYKLNNGKRVICFFAAVMICLIISGMPVTADGELENIIVGKWRWTTIEGDVSGSVNYTENIVVSWDSGVGSIEFFPDGTYFVTGDGSVTSASGAYQIDGSTLITVQDGSIPVTQREEVTIIDENSFVTFSNISEGTYYYERIADSPPATDPATEPPADNPPDEPDAQTLTEPPTMPQTGTHINNMLFLPIPVWIILGVLIIALGIAIIRRSRA